MAEYPKGRRSFFAHRVVRAALKACLAQEVGPEGIALLTAIAHTEDAKRYSSHVTYYNGQLMQILGIRRWERLDRIRRSLVDTGWLHYENTGTKAAGRYWVLMPDHVTALNDSPMDENNSNQDAAAAPMQTSAVGPQDDARGAVGGTALYTDNRYKAVTMTDTIPTRTRIQSHDGTGELSYLDPGPNPDPFIIQISLFIERWNNKDLPPIRRLTTGRRKRFEQMFTDPDWCWSEALDRLPLPDALDWQPDVSWFLKSPDNAAKIIEGAFEWRRQRTKQAAKNGPVRLKEQEQ